MAAIAVTMKKEKSWFYHTGVIVNQTRSKEGIAIQRFPLGCLGPFNYNTENVQVVTELHFKSVLEYMVNGYDSRQLYLCEEFCKVLEEYVLLLDHLCWDMRDERQVIQDTVR
jgi:hypothetical protein